MRTAIKEILFGQNLIGVFGRLFGAVSILSLTEYVFGYSFSDTIKALLSGYNQFIRLIPGGLELHILILVAWTQDLLSWDLALYPHWKHAVMLVGIYMWRSVWLTFLYKVEYGLYRLTIAILVALFAGVISGTAPVTQYEFWPNFWIAAGPVLGLLIYGAANGLYAALRHMSVETEQRPELSTRWTVFWGHTWAALRRTFVALAVLIAGLQIPFVMAQASPGLFMLIFLVLLSASRHLVEGMTQAKANAVGDETWKNVYWQAGSTGIGASMFSVFAWSVLIILADFALGAAGL